MSTEDRTQSKRKGGAGTVGIVFLIAVVFVMAGIIAYLLVSHQSEGDENERRNIVITPDNVQEVIEQMTQTAPEELTAPGYYTVWMNYEWHFASGDAVSEDAYVENLAVNTNAVYFDVFLLEDEENAVYKSPLLPLGSRLRDIALDTPLEAGTYDCVAVYHLVDDDQNTLSTLRVTVTLIVEG